MMPVSIVENIDCLVAMANFPDKFFELAVVDPPYGIFITEIWGASKYGYKQYDKKEWDKLPPPKEYFNELKRVSKNQIIWGGNYFELPPSQCWVIWDKMQRDFTLADAEMAWTSFKNSVRIFSYSRGAAHASQIHSKIHPTQKPVKLYKWLLKNYAKPGDKILDTHMGSQSSRIAAYHMGFDYWGYEIDQEYFEAGNKRFKEQTMQLSLL